MSERICSICGVLKPEDEYYVKAGRPAASCKVCHRAISRRYYDKTHRRPKAPHGHPCAHCGLPTPEKKYGGKPLKYCSRKCAHDGNAAAMKARGYARQKTLAQYGITLQEYEALRSAQGNVCAVCGTNDPATKSGEWHVDHCHNSQVVRGLLCARCNIGIGYFLDDPDVLRTAAAYLEATSAHRLSP